MADPTSDRGAPPAGAADIHPRPAELAAFWSEPVRGGHPGAETLGLDGIDQLTRGLAGDTPEAPLSRLTGLRLLAVDPGQASFALPLSGWLAGADGRIGLGPLSIPADAAMACAIMTQLPGWTPFTTAEMTFRVLHPVLPGGRVTAVGRVLDPGPPAALAEVAVHDDSGTLVAHGSSLCMTLPRISASALPPVPDGVPPAPETSPDPWQRTPPPAAPAASPGPAGAGLDALQAQVAGDRAPSPLERFTGLHPIAVAAGEARYALVASPWFCAPPPGRLQGGVIITLAEAAMSASVRTTLDARVPMRPVELKINLLRPLPSDGRMATAQARVVHAGRRIAVTEATVRDAGGRMIAMATGSALLGDAAGRER